MVDRTGSTGNRRQDTALLAAIELARDMGRPGTAIKPVFEPDQPAVSIPRSVIGRFGSKSAKAQNEHITSASYQTADRTAMLWVGPLSAKNGSDLFDRAVRARERATHQHRMALGSAPRHCADMAW